MHIVDIVILSVIALSVVSTAVMLIVRRRKRRDGQGCDCGFEGCGGCGDKHK